MTGAAQFQKSGDSHNLPFPVNPVSSGVLSFDGKAFTFSYSGGSCSVKVDRQMNFYLDSVISHAFASPEEFGRFLNGKFNLDYKNLRKTYLLGDAVVPLCRGLHNAMIYRAYDNIVLLDGSWVYVFQRQAHAPMNAEKSFDCVKAQTNIEHLICNNPDLVKLDTAVNWGFVAMQLVDSKEISYQDSVRVDQISWLKNVRNKCTSRSCLFDVYRARVKYIKGRISSAYPSYPAKEPDQDGD